MTFAGAGGQPGCIFANDYPSRQSNGRPERSGRSRSLAVSRRDKHVRTTKAVQATPRLHKSASRSRNEVAIQKPRKLEPVKYPLHSEQNARSAEELHRTENASLPPLEVERRDATWESQSATHGSTDIRFVTEGGCTLANHAVKSCSSAVDICSPHVSARDQNGATVCSADAVFSTISAPVLHERNVNGFWGHIQTGARSYIEGAQHVARVGTSAFVEVISMGEAAVGPQLEGNWGPVEEFLGGQEVGPLAVSAGALPAEFPSGTYIRNGPNPFFRPQIRESVFGKIGWHFFEGDGMLHAIRVGDGKVYYRNKFVETPALKVEKECGKALFWSNLEAQPAACLAGFLVNFLQAGSPIKETANTSVAHHSGRTFALNEAGLPIEVNLVDLTTIGPTNFDGKLKSRFTAHPKVDATTGEMIFFGYGVLPPHCTVGVLSPQGALIHSTSINIGRATLMHDFAITSRYTIVMDFPLTIDPWRVVNGGELVDFDGRGVARIGVLPRFGEGKSVQWFEVETGIAMHTMNAFEDGDEVVLHAFKQPSPLLKPPRGQSWKEFMPDALSPLESESSLLNALHEWRFNLSDGSVRERQVARADFLCDFPRMNEKFTGKRYRFGYGAVCDSAATIKTGLPYSGSVVKYQIPQTAADPFAEPIFHKYKQNEFGGEVVFVAREGRDLEEDDGWLVTFVHDVEMECSYFYVIDARDMEGDPVAKIKLPQRVPWGLHGLFVPDVAV